MMWGAVADLGRSCPRLYSPCLASTYSLTYLCGGQWQISPKSAPAALSHILASLLRQGMRMHVAWHVHASTPGCMPILSSLLRHGTQACTCACAHVRMCACAHVRMCACAHVHVHARPLCPGLVEMVEPKASGRAHAAYAICNAYFRGTAFPRAPRPARTKGNTGRLSNPDGTMGILLMGMLLMGILLMGMLLMGILLMSILLMAHANACMRHTHAIHACMGVQHVHVSMCACMQGRPRRRRRRSPRSSRTSRSSDCGISSATRRSCASWASPDLARGDPAPAGPRLISLEEILLRPLASPRATLVRTRDSAVEH